MTQTVKLMVRPKEAQAVLGIGSTKFWAIVKAGGLDVRKLGRATLITTESLRQFANGLPKAA